MDQQRLIAEARTAYERARLVRSLAHALPSLGLLLVMSLPPGGAIRPHALVSSVGMFVTTALALHVGRTAAAAVVPSLLFGLVPYVSIRMAESSHHVCQGTACLSWCLPACMIGGIVGGALVGMFGPRNGGRRGYSLTAITLLFLAGATGCRSAEGLWAIALGTTMGVMASWRVRWSVLSE